MEYQGFLTEIKYNSEKKDFDGTVIGARSDLEFHGKSIAELERNLKAVVNDYLEECKKKNLDPYRTYSGQIILRLKKDVHRQVETASKKARTSINKWIEAACEEKLERR